MNDMRIYYGIIWNSWYSYSPEVQGASRETSMHLPYTLKICTYLLNIVYCILILYNYAAII